MADTARDASRLGLSNIIFVACTRDQAAVSRKDIGGRRVCISADKMGRLLTSVSGGKMTDKRRVSAAIIPTGKLLAPTRQEGITTTSTSWKKAESMALGRRLSLEQAFFGFNVQICRSKDKRIT